MGASWLNVSMKWFFVLIQLIWYPATPQPQLHNSSLVALQAFQKWPEATTILGARPSEAKFEAEASTMGLGCNLHLQWQQQSFRLQRQQPWRWPVLPLQGLSRPRRKEAWGPPQRPLLASLVDLWRSQLNHANTRLIVSCILAFFLLFRNLRE